MSLSSLTKNAILNGFRNQSFAVASVYFQLHIGDPGENGTANPAVNTLRKVVEFGPPIGGEMTNSNNIQWTNVPVTETYTHGSLWDQITGGTCLWTGLNSAPSETFLHSTFVFAPGAITVSLVN